MILEYTANIIVSPISAEGNLADTSLQRENEAITTALRNTFMPCLREREARVFGQLLRVSTTLIDHLRFCLWAVVDKENGITYVSSCNLYISSFLAEAFILLCIENYQ